MLAGRLVEAELGICCNWVEGELCGMFADY